MSGEDEAAFEVREPDGKVYLIFAEGRIEGFAEGSIIFNRIPNMLMIAEAFGAEQAVDRLFEEATDDIIETHEKLQGLRGKIREFLHGPLCFVRRR